MTRPGWDSQFSQTESDRAERWQATKAARIAKGLCPLCAKTVRECKCEAHGMTLRFHLPPGGDVP